MHFSRQCATFIFLCCVLNFTVPIGRPGSSLKLELDMTRLETHGFCFVLCFKITAIFLCTLMFEVAKMQPH